MLQNDPTLLEKLDSTPGASLAEKLKTFLQKQDGKGGGPTMPAAAAAAVAANSGFTMVTRETSSLAADSSKETSGDEGDADVESGAAPEKPPHRRKQQHLESAEADPWDESFPDEDDDDRDCDSGNDHHRP